MKIACWNFVGLLEQIDHYHERDFTGKQGKERGFDFLRPLQALQSLQKLFPDRRSEVLLERLHNFRMGEVDLGICQCFFR